MEKVYRVGTRKSPLALKQVEELSFRLGRFYPGIKLEPVGIDSSGDKDRSTPISRIEGSDFFTREIDTALLEGKVDFSLHSAKDLPDRLEPELKVAVFTQSVDLFDVLVSKTEKKLYELKKGARVGTSSARRKNQLKAYRNDFRIVDIRGNIEERLKLLDETDLDAIVIAAAGLIRLGLAGRITERIPINILKPHPLQGSLAVVVKDGSEELEKMFSVLGKKSGKVYLVGAGPGREDLITLRGLNILRQADVVIYDYLAGEKLLSNAKKGAELISCKALGKNKNPNEAQKVINALIVQKAKEGALVVRLKGGDASIFSRVSEEAEVLKENKIEFEVVPGVTAASAAAAYSGIPLTERALTSSVTFATGHESVAKKEPINWEELSKSETLVLYMAVNNMPKIAGRLVAAGRPESTPVSAVSRAGDINQKKANGTLGNIAEVIKKEKIETPAIFIIGEVTRLGKKFDWSQKNKRILFTGLSDERFYLKGTHFHLPLIKIKPLEDYKEFDGYLVNIQYYDWLVFGSRYGVEHFFKRLKAVGYDARALSGISIAAVGSSTDRRLADFGVTADLVPARESSEGLIQAFKGLNLKNKKIFMPRSDLSDKGLGAGLEKLGALVTTGIAYRNVMPEDLPDLDLNTFDEIMFTSPSTVRNFIKRYGKPPKGIEVKYIGDVTRREAKKLSVIASRAKLGEAT